MLQPRSSIKELALQREQFSDFSKLAGIEYLHGLIPVSENFVNFIYLFFNTGACANTIVDFVRKETHVVFQDRRLLDT